MNCRRALVPALLLCCSAAHAQSIAYEFQTHPDSPVAIVEFTPATFRVEGDRRQFFTVKSGSDKVTAALVFQQTMESGSKTEIVTLERVSMVIKPREKKRLSVSVRDMWDRIQNAAKAGDAVGKAVLSIVVVEFIDGSVWNAPVEGGK